jgi:hypothetical protein
MARARFKEGVNFYDKGDFDQARASFLQAYALKKHPAVLLNLAWSCLKSGHPLEAERYFEQLPTEGDVSAKQRADAADGLSQARAKLGRIEVIAGSSNEVSVDGVRVGLAPLPEAVLVEPGAHTVKLTAADGASDIRRVTVLAGEKGVARFGVDEAPIVAPVEAPAVAPPPPPLAAVPETPVATALPPTAPSARDSEDVISPTHAAPPREASPEKSLFPANMVPMYLGGLITLAGTGVAIAMLEFKQNAIDKTNATVASVQNQGRTCPPPSGSADPALANVCSIVASDDQNVDADATIGNIALGIAVAGLVGTGLYWIFADKSEMTGNASNRAVIVPVLGRSAGGLSVSGKF